MTTDHVYPEDEGTGAPDGDFDDAANFAALKDASNQTDYVEAGLSVTPDYGVPDFDLSAGKCFISDGSATANQASESRDQGVTYEVEVAPRTGVSLTDAATNEIFVDLDLSSDDGVSITVTSDGSTPSAPYLKISEVDTAGDTETPYNRAPTGSFRSAFSVESQTGTSLLSITGSGPVEVQNADLDMSGRNVNNVNGVKFNDSDDNGSNWHIFNTGDDNWLRCFDGINGNEVFRVEANNDIFNISETAMDLRLATGQSIEDGSGNKRIAINGSDTRIYSDLGATSPQIGIDSSRYLRLYATSDAPVSIYDGEGVFEAFKYTTSSSAPGTLELTNANLVSQAGQFIGWPQQGSNDTQKPQLFSSVVSNTTEIKATDGAGNITTLT